MTPVNLFVCYAREDSVDVQNLRDVLDPLLQGSADYQFSNWSDHAILPGEFWAREIDRALDQAHFGLLLVSERFFKSEFINSVELPKLLAKSIVVPVALNDISLVGSNDLKILGGRQIFFDSENRAFNQCRDREHFARELFEKINALLKKYVGQAGPESLWDVGFEQLAKHEVRYIASRASSVSLDQGREAVQTSAARRDVVDFLLEWVRDPTGPPYCALFGELGMGKTTNAKEFSRMLWARRRNGESVPKSVFLDLKYVGEYAIKWPTLDKIIRRILRESWKTGDVTIPDVKAIRDLLKDGGLVIFDGLEEVLGPLTAQQGQQFTGQLLGLVPLGSRHGRLLITCRTHYFRTFKDQASHFRLEGRGNVKGEDYRALLLLPFDEQRIRTYLKNSFPDRDPERMWEFIQSVHNLPELAERPYALSLITQQFERLERWKASGNSVTGLTLYRLVVEEWLRDQGKDQIIPEHKQMLMEHVAAELVRAGLRSWSVGELEQWLMDFLDANRRIASHYEGKARELLKEDLRTATFLVREGTGDRFRFAHSSLQEYFLALYLRRALEGGDFAAWALRGVSPETLDFLGQSLLEDPSSAALKGLQAFQGKYHPGASEQAFAFGLVAHYKDYPRVPMTRFQLPGADLFGYEMGAAAVSTIDLSGANFRCARLGNTYWQNFKLAGADFSNADAAGSEWQNCDLRASTWTDAELEGAVFRLCDVAEMDFSGAHTHRTHWLRCMNADKLHKERRARIEVGKRRLQHGHSDAIRAATWSLNSRYVLSASNDKTLKIWEAASGYCLLTLSGHSDSVRACAWSPDGRRVLSASYDHMLKIWEAASGHCLLTLSGHSLGVNGCAWSPDGSRVLSASSDHTLKIWDAANGTCLRTLSGHSASVLGCAWSPKGGRVLSASYDNTLAIWDAANDDPPLSLSAHSGPVNACAWSPDGWCVLSASSDKTLKIWDAEKGHCLLPLFSHSDPVIACAWSPDGTHVLSASKDRTLKIWEAASGAFSTLSGHSGVIHACAWSPNSRRVLSASDDKTLRIWDSATGDGLLTLSDRSSSVNGCGWSPDADRVRVLSASSDGTLRIWDTTSGACLLTLTGHTGVVYTCAWSPDGRRVLSASSDDTLRIWDTTSGACLLTLSGHAGLINACAWSPGGTRVLSASHDHTLKIWDAASGESPLTLTGHSSHVFGCAWSPDGRRVLSASVDKTLMIWDASSGECLKKLLGHSNFVRSCAWSPNSLSVLSASSDHTLKIWDALTGNRLMTLSGHGHFVGACAWSPDGGRVLSASHDKTLKIWDAARGDCLRTLSGHSEPVEACAWSPDSRHVLSASSDGSLRIWDAETGVECGMQCWHLQSRRDEPTWATVDPKTGYVLNYGKDAWRSVGYVVPDDGGMPMWVPVEAVESK